MRCTTAASQSSRQPEKGLPINECGHRCRKWHTATGLQFHIRSFRVDARDEGAIWIPRVLRPGLVWSLTMVTPAGNASMQRKSKNDHATIAQRSYNPQKGGNKAVGTEKKRRVGYGFALHNSENYVTSITKAARLFGKQLISRLTACRYTNQVSSYNLLHMRPHTCSEH